MKRLLLVSVLATVVAVPSSALSSSDEASSQLSAKRGTFAIGFTVFTKNGKPKQVGNFEYQNVDVTCATGGPLSIDGDGFGDVPSERAKVKHKRFSKSYPGTSPGGGDTTQKFTGRFKAHNTKVEGTLRVKGTSPTLPPPTATAARSTTWRTSRPAQALRPTAPGSPGAVCRSAGT